MGSIPKNMSASRGAAILGLSKWKTTAEAWLELKELVQPGFCERNNYDLPQMQDSAPLRWGLAFENAIVDRAEKYQNIPIKDFEKSFSILNGRVTCHVDGIYRHGRKIYALHEGKTTNIHTYRDDWGTPGTDEIPRQYKVQVQHQMLCSEIKKCIVSVLVFPIRQNDYEDSGLIPEQVLSDRWVICNRSDDQNNVVHTIDPTTWAVTLDEMGLFNQYIVQADPLLQQAMSDAYNDFWDRCIIGDNVPDPQNYSDIKRMIRAPRGTIVANQKLEELSSEYKAITSEMREMAQRKEQLKTELLKRMNKMKAEQDEENANRWVLVSETGKKLHTYNGKAFR